MHFSCRNMLLLLSFFWKQKDVVHSEIENVFFRCLCDVLWIFKFWTRLFRCFWACAVVLFETQQLHLMMTKSCCSNKSRNMSDFYFVAHLKMKVTWSRSVCHVVTWTGQISIIFHYLYSNIHNVLHLNATISISNLYRNYLVPDSHQSSSVFGVSVSVTALRFVVMSQIHKYSTL